MIQHDTLTNKSEQDSGSMIVNEVDLGTMVINEDDDGTMESKFYKGHIGYRYPLETCKICRKELLSKAFIRTY